MIITIKDDFSLDKIIDCGQCFRARRMEDGTFRFICRGHLLYIKRKSETKYDASCERDEWDSVWRSYFDMGRDYSSIGRDISDDLPHGDFMRAAVRLGRGIRVLRQDAWEMLITFIISQRKNIPAITQCVEMLSSRYGRKIISPPKDNEEIFSFPLVEDMAKVPEKELRDCSLGYRAPYIADASERVASGKLDLAAIEKLDDDELFDALMSVKGVGKKVANCVMLFGYGRTSRVPVDVWIARALEICEGEDPFAPFGEDAGIMQQYVFYYMKHRSK